MAVNRKRPEQYTAAIEFLDNVLDREQKRIVLPLLDESSLTAAGRDLFGIEAKTAASAVRDLLHSRDGWLTACAMATAAELKLTELEEEIRQVAGAAGAEVAAVARSAAAALR